MNVYLLIVLAALVGRYLLDLVADGLNLRHVDETLPPEFEGWYDAGKYRTSQRYLFDHTRFAVVHDSVVTAVSLVMVLAGGFNLADRLARAPGWPMIPTGLLFAGILGLGLKFINLPFSVYETFGIEERYGFNKTTPRTFVLDVLKSLLLAAVIGGPLLALVLWFFSAAGAAAWLYCWIAVVVVQVFLVFIAPVVLMPLFNTFTPLEPGPLRTAIEDYAHRQNFHIRGVYSMDGSRRSSRSNAFFTGVGRSRRIVLFDTLIERHTISELVAIVAHEMGHYRQHHIRRAIIRGAVVTGITFFLLSRFIGNRALFDAFGMQHVSLYAGLVFFGFLYAPIALLLSIAEHAVSRRHEYAADRFAADTTGDTDALITALKKLSTDNLANLTPHPFKVFLAYSHPPVLQRIRALRRR
ncbi:MAG: M48 family metallopeptidase [Phycisphaerae bacterium]|nr:M48 family metallopeptidase [Phycisphaerae bacterium]